MTLSERTKNAIWLRHVLTKMNTQQISTVIYKDKSGTIDWAERGPARCYSKRKHIDIRHHFIKNEVQEAYNAVVKVPNALKDRKYYSHPSNLKTERIRNKTIGNNKIVSTSTCGPLESRERAGIDNKW